MKGFSFLKNKEKKKYNSLVNSLNKSLDKQYSSDITYFKSLIANRSIVDKKKLELAAKTIMLESMYDRFNVGHFMNYLKLLSNDLLKEYRQISIEIAYSYFKHNVISFFAHETKIDRFIQPYFIEDCFLVVNGMCWNAIFKNN